MTPRPDLASFHSFITAVVRYIRLEARTKEVITPPSCYSSQHLNSTTRQEGHAADMPNSQEGPDPEGHAGPGVSDHRDSFATRAIHVGSAPDPVTGAIIPGLHTATTYKQYGVGKPIVSLCSCLTAVLRHPHQGLTKQGGHDYSRGSNPTRTALESLLTSLETCPDSYTSVDGHDDASGGEALVFASGSAATAAMAYWASLQRSEGGGGGSDGVKGGGGHVLAVNDCVSMNAWSGAA
jgi:hypothetical protein